MRVTFYGSYFVLEDIYTISLILAWNQQVLESSNKILFSEMKCLMYIKSKVSENYRIFKVKTKQLLFKYKSIDRIREKQVQS